MERFDRQDDAYRESVLPKTCRNRLAVEAGVSDLWRKYVGLEGVIVGIDRFGLSAPGDTVLSELGISVDNVVKQAALAGLGSKRICFLLIANAKAIKPHAIVCENFHFQLVIV